MKNIVKNLIIILIVATIAIIVTIIILQIIDRHNTEAKNQNQNIISTGKNEINTNTNINQEEAPLLTLSDDIKKEQTESVFYAIGNCINKYYEAIDKRKGTQVYNLLDKQYVEDRNITTTNIFSIVENLKEGFEKFRVKEVYYRDLDLSGKTEYYVLGNILTKNYSSLNSVYIIVSIDYANKAFSITPSNLNIEDDSQYYNVIKQLSNEKINNTPEISLNEDNKYTPRSLTTKEILQFYLDDYTTMALHYPEIAYNILDEQYRNKRFENIEEYKIYIELNKSRLTAVIPIEYGFTEKDSNKQYTIIDNYNNAYVIKISDTMEYTIISDIYTVNLDSIIEKYDEGSNEDKVQINIQKIVNALNNKDYKYVYDKLSDDFKTNKYPTIESLKNDITIYGSCYVTFNESSSNQDKYMYDIEIKGNTVSSSNLKMKITMQLKDERDFVFEFEPQNK